MVLPTIYVLLALRAVLPLVLPTAAIFWMLVVLLWVVAWPFVARGVRAIVAAERRREYALAALALGAGPVRILLRHLLPATTGFLRVQVTLLLPPSSWPRRRSPTWGWALPPRRLAGV